MSALQRLYSPPEIGAPGKRQARHRRRGLLLAGGFVLLATALTAATLALLSPTLFGSSYRLRAYFDNATGLERGIQVLQDGYTIGTVEAVQPVFPGRDADAGECPSPGRAATRPCFRATLRLDDDWPVPVDSVAQIASAGLLAGDAILVTPGTADTLLAADAVLPASGRAPDLMARLNALSDTLQRLVDDTIAPALASIEAQIAVIGDLLGTTPQPSEGADADTPVTGGAAGDLMAGNRERLAGAFESLRRITADIEAVVDPEQIAGILGAVQRLTDNLAAVSATFADRSNDVSSAVQGYGALADDLRRVIQQNEPGVQSSIDSAQYLLQELSAGLAPILANIENASRELAALARELRAQPSTVIRGREQQEQSPWFNR